MTNNKLTETYQKLESAWEKDTHKNELLMRKLDNQIDRLRFATKAYLLCSILAGIGVITTIAGLGAMVTPKSYFCNNNKQTKVEQRVNTADIRVFQEGSGKNVIKCLDYKPFGSLDEIVRVKDGNPEVLRVGDKGFNEYMKDWKPYKPF